MATVCEADFIEPEHVFFAIGKFELIEILVSKFTASSTVSIVVDKVYITF